ncbi:MAG: hypothetical protein Q9181_000659 [Wetmoreana brouardii]
MGRFDVHICITDVSIRLIGRDLHRRWYGDRKVSGDIVTCATKPSKQAGYFKVRWSWNCMAAFKLTQYRLLASATNLLVLLSNPSNVALLTAHILSAPAIWGTSANLQMLARVIDVFSSSSGRLLRSEQTSHFPEPSDGQRNLSTNDWTAAIMKGTAEGSPWSRKVLVFTGLLQGFKIHGGHGLNMGQGTKLRVALVKAINLSLRSETQRSPITDLSMVVALSQVFDLLDVQEKTALDHDSLLPMLVWAIFSSSEGLHQGYFLSTIDADVIEGAGKKFDWSTKSHSYLQLQFTATGPLIAALGRLSRLMAFSVGRVKDVVLLVRILQILTEFSRSLSIQWRQNKLSEIDISEETVFLADETLRMPLPLLWRVLRSCLYAIIIILIPYTDRLLYNDLSIKDDAAADVLSQYPVCSEAFLREIQPTDCGIIPQHPLDRCLDLYFLNTAEQLALVLDTKAASDLLVVAASPYLGVDSDQRLLEAFEAAHSVMLAVIAAPHNVSLAISQFESYTKVLFQVFPQTLSPRQFRVATKQLVRIASSPSLISEQRPFLASALLEIVHLRLQTASTQPIGSSITSDEPGDNADSMSEQAVLLLALIDSLPFLQLDALEDWLWIVARSIHLVRDIAMRHACKQRFWEILSNGDMDVDRAAYCSTWWSTRGGRPMMLYGKDIDNFEPLMSGPLKESRKL